MGRRDALLAGAAFALLALMVAPAYAQSTTTYVFPPLCNCTRDAKKSPYRLTPLPPTNEGIYVKYCFDVVDIGGCDPKYKCCNGKQGVQKIEFDVEVGCKDSLKRVTVDGNQKSFEYNTILSVLRVTNLNRTVAEAPGTEVCLFLKADTNCTTLNSLCGLGGACKYAIFNQDRDCCPVSLVGASPPPPSPSPARPFAPSQIRSPPPPPTNTSSFPKCACIRNPAASKLTTTLTSVTTGTVANIENVTTACFTVKARNASCLLGSPCCEFSPYKFEVDADPVCSSSLMYTTVDGVKNTRLFQMNPYPAIKVTGMDKTFADAAGTEICLVLKPPCNSLKSLCNSHDGKCRVALFNSPQVQPACCPIANL